jgi:hypothetical protein
MKAREKINAVVARQQAKAQAAEKKERSTSEPAEGTKRTEHVSPEDHELPSLSH